MVVLNRPSSGASYGQLAGMQLQKLKRSALALAQGPSAEFQPRGAAESLTDSPIIFLHVPKTGGTSLANMLKAPVDPKAVLHAPAPGLLAAQGATELGGARFIHGHLDWDDLEAIPGPRRTISYLREPVARVLSLYWYWRSFSQDYAERTGDVGIQYARSVGLEAFFREAPDGIRANYENAMVRQLAGASVCAPYVGFNVPEETALDLARAHLDEMTVCGVCEAFEASSVLTARRLNLAPMPIRRDAVTRTLSEGPDFEPVEITPPSPSLVRHLRDLTALDLELYHHALQHLARDLARM